MCLTESHCGTDLVNDKPSGTASGCSYAINRYQDFHLCWWAEYGWQYCPLSCWLVYRMRLLARRGISLFIVPKFSVDESSKKGERNQVSLVVRLNIKMGIQQQCKRVWWLWLARKAFLIGESESRLELHVHFLWIPHVCTALQGLAQLYCWMGIAKLRCVSPKMRPTNAFSLSGRKAPEKVGS